MSKDEVKLKRKERESDSKDHKKEKRERKETVSYTHLTLPTKRIV